MNTQKGINRIDYAALEHNQQLRKSAHELRDVSVRAVNDLRVAIIQCRKLEISLDTIHRRLRSNSQSPN